MAKRGTLYRCHLCSFLFGNGGPQTRGVVSRWTYDLVPVNEVEISSGTEVELLVEIDESAGLTLEPDLMVRFDILEEDYLLTGGQDDFIVSLLGTATTQPESDFRTEQRETIFYELDEGDDVLENIRRFKMWHPQTYRSTILVLEQPSGEGLRYTIVAWWTAERLEDYANSEFYFIVNVNETFDDQSGPIMDVNPERWNPDEGDPRVWVPMSSGRKIYELLTTRLTDWVVTTDEANQALEILKRLRPEDLLRVTMMMRLNGTFPTLKNKLSEGNPIRFSQFLALEIMLDPNLGYLVPGDRIGVLVFAGSSTMPEFGGFSPSQYETFLRENEQVADAIDSRQNGLRPGEQRVFVDPSRLSDTEADQLGSAQMSELVRANIPSFDLDEYGRVRSLPMLDAPLKLDGYSPGDAANLIARQYFSRELVVRPRVTLFFLQRGAPYLGQPGRLATGNKMVPHNSTFVPDPNLPSVRRSDKLGDYHAYLSPLRDPDPQVLSAVMWYYDWISQHIDQPEFFDRKPEDLWAEALRVALTPPPQSPLEPYLRFARLMEERLKTATQEEKSRIQRASYAYWAWVDGHNNEAALAANDPGRIWADGYVAAVHEEVEKEIERQARERAEQRRQLDFNLIDRKLGEALNFVIHNVYAARDPYVVEGVEESRGFFGLFAEKRGIGYLVMPSETEKAIRSALGGAYLDDIFSRMTQPGFRDVDIRKDFLEWLDDRPQMAEALSASMTYPYTERYEFEVDLPAWQTAIEIGIGFVPIVGQIVGAAEAISGTSLFGRPLGPVEQGITAAAILLPAAAKLTRTGVGLVHASTIAREYNLTGREAQALYRACLPIAKGTKGNRLLLEAAEDVRAGRRLTDATKIRELENLVKEMGLTDRATARALTLPPPPELTGAALATEDRTVSLIHSVFGEQSGAYRALNAESRTAVRAAIRSESALFRQALVAETSEGYNRYVDRLLKQMELYGMNEQQRQTLKQALETLNTQHRTALSDAVRALSRERIIAVGSSNRVTQQGGLLITRYDDRISKLQAFQSAATDKAARRRLTNRISRLRRERRRLQNWLSSGNQRIEEFQRLLSEQPNLRRLVKSGGDDMLLQHWINFNARPSGRAVVSTFAEYVERMQGQYVGMLGEIEVSFRLSRDWILIKVPDDMVTIPGTDLIAISRTGGPLRFIDNKAFTSSEVEAVDALTRNFTRNLKTDLDELARIAADPELPTHFRLAFKRISRANTAIQNHIKGLTREQIASPAVQQDLANILRQENIERVVTNAGGQVTDINADLRIMGIDLWDLN